MSQADLDNQAIERLRQQFMTPSQEEVNANLGRAFSERPAEILYNVQQNTKRDVLNALKPQIFAGAKHYLSQIEGFGDTLKLASVQKILGAELEKTFSQYGSIPEEYLNEFAERVSELVKESREIKVKSETAKQRMTQISTKSSSGEEVHIDPRKKYDEMMNRVKQKNTRENRIALALWLKSEEGKKVVSALEAQPRDNVT